LDLILGLIEDYLKYVKDRNAWQEEIDAGGDGKTKEQIDKEEENWNNEKDKLDKRKVDVLNRHIFPAMANLTVLVEQMHEHPGPRKIFDGDLRYLFLARASPEVNKSKSKIIKETGLDEEKREKSVFQRFIEASSKMNMTTINITEFGIDKTSIPDFRLVLCRIMQLSICETMRDIAPSKFDDPGFVNETMMVDMNRALAWTKEVSHKAWISELSSYGANKSLSYHKKRRPALF
jgi:hypothetical protein